MRKSIYCFAIISARLSCDLVLFYNVADIEVSNAKRFCMLCKQETFCALREMHSNTQWFQFYDISFL